MTPLHLRILIEGYCHNYSSHPKLPMTARGDVNPLGVLGEVERELEREGLIRKWGPNQVIIATEEGKALIDQLLTNYSREEEHSERDANDS